MRKLSIFILTLSLPFLAMAEQVPCNCPENLRETITKTEINYAGFPDKVTSKTKPAYQRLVAELSAQALREREAKGCFYLLKRYVRFFNDKHFSLTYLNEQDADSQTEIIQDSYFKFLKPGTGPEGIWTNPDSSLTLGIKKYGAGEYKAIVLKATSTALPKGLVYFSLKPHKNGYLLSRYNVFNSVDFYAQQKGGLLQLWNFAMFGRISPAAMTGDEKKELSTWTGRNNGLDFYKLDQETSYIKIPTFFNNDSQIQKLVSTNDKTIRSSKYLVIDLRGNGGGNSGWSFLLPYVMTNPIKQDDPMLRISKDNVKLKRSELDYVVNHPLDSEMKKYYPDPYLDSLKKIDRELPSSKEIFYTVPGLTIPVDSVLSYPEKVALITDELCGSSTEYFFQLMKQSTKTIRYGSNSVGMMDYEGPSSPTPLPCTALIFMMPVSKSSWTDKHPIDQVGFTPDVKLGIPKDQWLKYILKDLKIRK